MKRLSLFILLFVIILSILSAGAQDEINIGGEVANTPSPVLSADIWETLQTDYFSAEIEIARLTVDAESSLSILEPTIEDCTGAITSSPTYKFQWDRASLEEELPLRIFAVSSEEDLILVIREPDGDWYCNDDFETVTDPMIEIPLLRSGDYLMWVGSKTNDELFTARLFLSIGSHTPLRPPAACCEGLAFSNPADTATEATITYVEVDAGTVEDPDADRGIVISVDVTYRGESGDSFVTELYIYDASNDVEISRESVENRDELCAISTHPCDAERLRRNSARRDFSTGSQRGPIQFSVPDLDSAELGIAYYLEIRLSILNEAGEIAETADSMVIGR